MQPRALSERPLVRAGAYAWALIGIAVVALGVAHILGMLRVVAVPLFLALFPTALLAPVVRMLRRRRIPRALAALAVLLGFVLLFVAVIRLLSPQVAEEIPRLGESLRTGLEELRGVFGTLPYVPDAAGLDEMIARGRDAFERWLRQEAVTLAAAVAEGVAGLLFGMVALFFFLKDGDRIAAWLRDLFPAPVRSEAQTIGESAWNTLGSYFRGQLLVAFVDALFIGLGLVILRIPLALPLAVLVFIGGLFPIVGAFISGAVAVLVALAHAGPLLALVVLGLVVAVQQLESNILAPVVLGRATQMHPLAVITALTAGGIVLGVLGAFIAVPIAAATARAIDHLRAEVS